MSHEALQRDVISQKARLLIVIFLYQQWNVSVHKSILKRIDLYILYVWRAWRVVSVACRIRRGHAPPQLWLAEEFIF